MDDLDRFDPQLFGIWRQVPAYGDATSADMSADVRNLVLETKSGEAAVSPAEAQRRLLNRMTEEMQAQFDTFRDMRRAAEAELAGDDDTAQKLARADIKAATDAMSLIVRTLEKIDSLQRQLARDRREEAEQSADEGGYEEARERLLALIESKADERAHEKARTLFEAWKRDGAPESAPSFAGTGPPVEPA